MSAQFVDALKGYEHFRSKRGHVSIDEVNDFLTQNERNPISVRTYGHYHKLISHGFRSYIPINKFDVFQSIGKIQLAADRRRYQRNQVKQKAKISKNRSKWIDVTITDKSLVGFGVLTTSKFPSTPGSQIWVRVENFQDIPVILVWRKHLEDSTWLGLRAFEFVAKYQLLDHEVDIRRLRSILKITRIEEGELDWDNFARVLFKTEELLEASSDLIISVDETVDTHLRLAKAVLASIRFGSPGEAQIKIDLGIAEILKVVFEKLQFWREEKIRYKAETKKLELDNANLAIETVRNAINLKKEAEAEGLSKELLNEIISPVARVLGVKQLSPELFEPGSIEEGIFTERLLPAATELIAGDDLDFDIEIDI